MLTVCVGRRNVRVRRGSAVDAGNIVNRPRGSTRVSPADPKGRVLKGWGWRPVPLAMPPASPRGTILTQTLENAAQTISITRTGS